MVEDIIDNPDAGLDCPYRHYEDHPEAAMIGASGCGTWECANQDVNFRCPFREYKFEDVTLAGSPGQYECNLQSEADLVLIDSDVKKNSYTGEYYRKSEQ